MVRYTPLELSTDWVASSGGVPDPATGSLARNVSTPSSKRITTGAETRGITVPGHIGGHDNVGPAIDAHESYPQDSKGMFSELLTVSGT